MDVPWKFLITQFGLLLFMIQRIHSFKQSGTCYFPERWEGTWFQSGVRQPILIEGPILSTKGRCLNSEGDKFLLVDDVGKIVCSLKFISLTLRGTRPNSPSNPSLQYNSYLCNKCKNKRACYKCVVIHEKHINVLQYKETYCHGRESLPTLCGLITGDALLYSMFRENAVAIPCPFRGPFSFTYNRGYGECMSPVSSIDVCTEDSKLLLSYQACPDVHGSESAIEELECLAVWKEGSSRYLVGKLHHNHATSNEDRFRCFVYEKSSSTTEVLDGIDYRVAQSGDATCNGLFSAIEGSRTMTLRKAPTTSKCRFPYWVANYNHWHTLDYSVTYSFHHRNSTLRITNTSGTEMKVLCVQSKVADDNVALLIAHFTMGCENGFIGMSFYRRDVHVIEVQIGAQTKRKEDALNTQYFNKSTLPYITLVTTSPETRACPYMGKFEVDNLIQSKGSSYSIKQSYLSDRSFLDSKFSVHSSVRSVRNSEPNRRKRRKRLDQDFDCDSNGFTNLIVGCNSYDTMEFRMDCPTPDLITSYTCHGGWLENGTHFLITTPLSRVNHGSQRYCFIYRELSNIIMFSTSADNCNRLVKPGITGDLIFNISSTGKCLETSTSTHKQSSSTLLLILLILNFIFVINTFVWR